MMTEEQIREIKKGIILTASYYGRDIKLDVVNMMAEDLNDLPFEDVSSAFLSYRRNAKNKSFPLPAQIREIINPEVGSRAKANEVASRIRKGISDFGWCNGEKAREYIGELGWKVVIRSGGWQYLCENHGLELNPLTYQAQARDLVESTIEMAGIGFVDEPIGLPEP